MKITQTSPVLKTLGLTAAGLVAVTLVACGGGSDAPQGTLRLAMTDAPSCGYDHVYVTVDRIRVNQSATASNSDAGWSELVVPNQRIDLLNLTNGVLQELGSLPLAAGSYQQVRLVLAANPNNPTPANPLANALVLAGSTTEIPLATPSGQQSGYKLQAHFDVTGWQVADMVMDFDACKSIVKAGNSGIYNLKPVVAVIERLTTQIVGYVGTELLANDVVVSTRDPQNNLRSTVPDPITGKFTLAYLPESTNYTVVVSGQNLTTAAVTSVPVSLATGTTQITTAAAPIRPASSTVGTVTGTVTNSTSALLTDADVTAKQTLTSGKTLDVNWQPVDATAATYSFNLPLAAPVFAAYAGGAALTFAPDSPVAASYTINATATGYLQTTAPGVTLASTNTLINPLTKNLTLAPSP